MSSKSPLIMKLYLNEPLEFDVLRTDGSMIRCPLVVNPDGSLGVKPPRGEWLHTPPPQPLVGQEIFDDSGDAP